MKAATATTNCGGSVMCPNIGASFCSALSEAHSYNRHIELRAGNPILSLGNRHYFNLGDGNMITRDELEAFIDEILRERK